jgi:hypothetical protein
MDFVALTLGLVFLLFLILVGLGRAFQSHRVADFLDWKPTRSPEVEAQNEVDDVRQMIEAQNEYRRRRGAAEITREDVERQAREDQQLRARGSGPFAQRGEVMDELDAPGAGAKARAASRKGAPRKRGGAKKPAPAKKRAPKKSP